MVFISWRLCINIYAQAIDVSITLHLIRLKIEQDKEHIRSFCFHQNKSAANAHRVIYETYDENIIIIRMRKLI